MRLEVEIRAMHAMIGIGLLFCAASVAGAQTGSGAPAASSTVLPKDIDPQSFSRLPVMKRDDMDEDGKHIYDLLAGGEGKTAIPTGPVAISLYSPKVAEAIQMLNQYLRFHGVLKPRDFEVAILVAAREFDQQYEWSGHEMAARAAKVPQQVIDAIKFNKPAEGFSDRDTLIVTFARDSFHGHRISSDLYAKAVETFGKQGTLELATIIGDYAMAAIMLNATDQHLPPGRPELLPAK
jgi:4-carboxymuconolactone decarboxylase